MDAASNEVQGDAKLDGAFTMVRNGDLDALKAWVAAQEKTATPFNDFELSKNLVLSILKYRLKYPAIVDWVLDLYRDKFGPVLATFALDERATSDEFEYLIETKKCLWDTFTFLTALSAGKTREFMFLYAFAPKDATGDIAWSEEQREHRLCSVLPPGMRFIDNLGMNVAEIITQQDRVNVALNWLQIKGAKGWVGTAAMALRQQNRAVISWLILNKPSLPWAEVANAFLWATKTTACKDCSKPEP